MTTPPILQVERRPHMDLESALSFEAGLTAQLYTTEDKAEGMRAFLEKREPRFKGR